MDRKFQYKWIDCNFIVSFLGDIGFKDIVEANNIIFGDIRFDQMKYQIFDYSQINSVDLKVDIAEVISRLDLAAKVWNNKVKVATVTPDPDLKKLIANYNEKMADSPWLTKTFDTLEEAMQWCTED